MTAAPKKVLSKAVEWQLLVTVYNQTTTLVIGGAGLAGAALFGWLHTRQTWFLIWALAAVVALVARLLLDHSFRQSGEGIDGLRVWRNRFIAGAWVMSGLWGVAALGITLPVDATVRLLLISVQIALAMGTVSRSAGCPPAVKGQILLTLGPLAVACFAKGDSDHLILGFFVCALIAATLVMLRQLYAQTVRLLRTIEDNEALVKRVRQANSEIAVVNSQLKAMATTDALTGIGNRRLFDDVLSKEVLRVRSDTNELSVLMLDVDTFKDFNDNFGHQAGDVCLRRIATTLSAALRAPDMITRYGGEEFAAILPQTNSAGAAVLAEKMRAKIEALAIPSVLGVVTVSIGVATFAAEQHGRPDDYIRAADQALYMAKGAGRNCVRVAPVPIGR